MTRGIDDSSPQDTRSVGYGLPRRERCVGRGSATGIDLIDGDRNESVAHDQQFEIKIGIEPWNLVRSAGVRESVLAAIDITAGAKRAVAFLHAGMPYQDRGMFHWLAGHIDNCSGQGYSFRRDRRGRSGHEERDCED